MSYATQEKSQFPPGTVADNLGHFAHDLVTLAELQFELLKSDASECAEDAFKNLAVAIMAAAIALGTVPILLLSLAYGLHEAGMPIWLCLLIAAAAGLLTAAALIVIAVRGLRRSTTSFETSRRELKLNLSWVKQVLRRKKTPLPSESRFYPPASVTKTSNLR